MLLEPWMIDCIFAFGTSLFLTSSIPAIIKVRRVKYSDAQSLVHNEIHMIALSAMLIGYLAMLAPISITITLIEIVIRLFLIKLIRKKRSHKLTYKSDIAYYILIGLKILYRKLRNKNDRYMS